MVTVLNMQQRFKRLDFNREIRHIFARNQKFFKDMVQGQMLQGLRGDGQKIGSYRSKAYADEKFAMNSLAGRFNVDLRLTGSFYDGIYFDFGSEEIEISSSDSKADMLAEKYSDNIFNLTTESKTQINTDLTVPDLLKYISNVTGLEPL